MSYSAWCWAYGYSPAAYLPVRDSLFFVLLLRLRHYFGHSSYLFLVLLILTAFYYVLYGYCRDESSSSSSSFWSSFPVCLGYRIGRAFGFFSCCCCCCWRTFGEEAATRRHLNIYNSHYYSTSTMCVKCLQAHTTHPHYRYVFTTHLWRKIFGHLKRARKMYNLEHLVIRDGGRGAGRGRPTT